MFRHGVILLCFLAQALAQYDLNIYLLQFSAGAGFLANGQHCDLFWFAGNLQCNLRMSLCVEPLSGSPSQDLTTCGQPGQGGQYVDLGNVTTNQNSITFQNNMRYGDWSNPLPVRVPTGQYAGFQVKLMVYHDNGVSPPTKLIDQYVHTFTTSITEGTMGYANIRSSAPDPTVLTLAWSLGAYDAPPATTTVAPASRDCSDIYQGQTEDGVFNITLGNNKTVAVFCDFSGGGWTVIQNRADTTNFNLSFTDYEGYFGVPSLTSSYWLGLQNMNSMTSITDDVYMLKIELCCGNATRSETYDYFKIGDTNSNYPITVSAGSGSAGDGFENVFFGSRDNGSVFSAPGKYQGAIPEASCPSFGGNSGWWFGSCANNLNGYLYTSDSGSYSNAAQCILNAGLATGRGITWNGLTTTSTKARMKTIPSKRKPIIMDPVLEQQKLLAFCNA